MRGGSIVMLLLSAVCLAVLCTAQSKGSSHEAHLLRSHRLLQFEVPDYTSPPTQKALDATPSDYRDDAVIELGRAVAAAGNCSADPRVCQIVFDSAVPDTPVGVVYYGGALVDPRAYSVVAQRLARNYGVAVSVPIFAQDVQFLGCFDTGRVDLAARIFPEVQNWVLAGHSFGGIAALVDIWNRTKAATEGIDLYGLVLMGSFVPQDLGCGSIDFSDTKLPAASVLASEDRIVNETLAAQGLSLLSGNDTFRMDILGGNHQQFGSYNDSERSAVLNQTDGVATIGEDTQLELVVGAVLNVVDRLPQPRPEVLAPSPASPELDGPAASDQGDVGAHLLMKTLLVSVLLIMM